MLGENSLQVNPRKLILSLSKIGKTSLYAKIHGKPDLPLNATIVRVERNPRLKSE